MCNRVFDSCRQMEIPLGFLDISNHPTPTDLKRNMSSGLVEVYLDTCTPTERVLFGRDKPLKGPGSLWISPDDRLSGNRVRQTPIKAECVQALTHLGILEIGKRIEEKVEEQNMKLMTRAVAEAGELAKFEADEKIKFHVDVETQKLNEEWKNRLAQLTLQHEEEKRRLIELNGEACDLLRASLAKKYEHETQILLEETIAATTNAMETNCSNKINDELMQQSIYFEEQLQNTLKNLETIDKERMMALRNQCIDSMDLQQALLACRQMTETMHMMVTNEKNWRMRMTDMKNGFSDPMKDTSGHQSKSLKQLWIEFQHRIDGFDGEELQGDEKVILDRLQHISAELMMEKRVSTSRGCSITQARDGRLASQQNVDGIGKPSECLQIKRAPYVDVKWKSDDIRPPTVDSFVNRFLQPQCSMHWQPAEIASSIIEMVEKSDHRPLLKENIIALLEQVMGDFVVNKLESIVVPMSRTEAVSIKDSMEVIKKRVSVRDEPRGSSKLLSVVDSLELMNKTSRVTSTKTSTQPAVERCENFSDKPSSGVPPYLKNQRRSLCETFERMTDDDWNKLKRVQQMGVVEKSSRQSSVWFDGSQPIGSKLSKVPSKHETIETKSEIDDLLNPIHQKCRNTLKGMKLESVLKLLCEDS